ncbi:hypothetical protein MMC10_006551 [Thelotrema lepadinum]|nr:hypothetical protein [Thelotrema lepadinum]
MELHEALSGVTGSISLAAWVFVLVPQLWENYRLQSAEGISLTFLFVWFIGDLTNLVGSVWAQLVPTVIALAVYFCIADAILISQCLYYNYVNARKTQKELSHEPDGVNGRASDDPSQPLLNRTVTVGSTNSIGLPGSHRRSSASTRRRSSTIQSPLLPTIDEEQSTLRVSLKNATAVLIVSLLGALGWVFAWKTGWWQPTPTGDDSNEPPRILGAELLGYISAIAYLGARVPQIWKNYTDKSCEGLSLLFFMLSMLGNLTYGASILLHSVEPQYVLKSLPWLIGSLGTITEDLAIFAQFRLYSTSDKPGESSVAVV